MQRKPVHTVGLGFGTIKCRPMAGNYQLSHLKLGWDSNSGLRRREVCVWGLCSGHSKGIVEHRRGVVEV